MLLPQTRRKLGLYLSRAGIILFAVSHLLATLGVPLPANAFKDLSVPFPCQNNPCGCRTAQECWLHCHCHTLEQRLAWAKKHGVEPPSYLQDRLARGWDTRKKSQRRTGTDNGCSLCQDSPNPLPQGPSCCSSSPCASCCEPEDKKHPTKCQWFAALAELHCQGLSLWWAWTGASLPPPLPICWSVEQPLCGFVTTLDTRFSQRSDRPPLPPPRAHLSSVQPLA
ncbi:MAG: hypothetical protein NZM31_02565 [Gemmatales bacterium]|nr:hypothetical protein [Gemmatales bacterium]MDW8385882.1 hypothetical protein [Gemmatales bacterium]